MIKAIIFDFYGVIRSDDYGDWLTRHGLPRDPSTKHATKSLDKGEVSVDEFFESLSRFSNIPPDEIRKDFAANASLNKKLLALVLRLKDNYKIALLSNASSSHLKQILSSAGIDELFDEVIVSSDIGYTKPAPEIFNYALSKLGVKAEESVFIDDSKRFVEAAQEIGLNAIAYTDLKTLITELKQMGIINN